MPKTIFVSYAHADDIPPYEGIIGWASAFIEALKSAIGRHTGSSEFEIWIDHLLRPNAEVNDELKQKIQSSEVILALISPRYLDSPWCQAEMATFISEVGKGSSSERVFLVETLPTERKNWHEKVKNLAATKFWSNSLTKPKPKTLGWPLPDARSDRDFWTEINELASHIAEQLGRSISTAPLASKQNSQPNQEPPLTHDAPLSILINADAPDQSLALDTQNALADLNVDAYLAPVMASNQNPADYRRAFEDGLKANHGIVMIYGTAPATWVQAKFSDMRKVLALHRKGTWAGLLEGPPEPKDHHGLPPRNLMVLNCKQGIDKAELARFVEALKGGASHV